MMAAHMAMCAKSPFRRSCVVLIGTAAPMSAVELLSSSGDMQRFNRLVQEEDSAPVGDGGARVGAV